MSIESGEYKLPYDMRIIEAMGLLRYNPAKMLVAFSTYYRDELQRKVTAGNARAIFHDPQMLKITKRRKQQLHGSLCSFQLL